MTSETKQAQHTPGPWEQGGDYVTDSTGKLVAATSEAGAAMHADQWGAMGATFTSDANARLIAAAPKMLEALEYVQAWIQQTFIMGPDAGGPPDALIEAAIREAKGEGQ